MRLNKETLKQIIREELEAVLDESALLKKFKDDKEAELRNKLKDMGKPASTLDDLKKHSPHQLASIGQALDPGYPGTFVDTAATSGYKAGTLMSPYPPRNPYGGRFFYAFEPEGTLESGAREGSISLFTVPPQTGELEFVTAYAVEDVDEELKKLSEKG